MSKHSWGEHAGHDDEYAAALARIKYVQHPNREDAHLVEVTDKDGIATLVDPRLLCAWVDNGMPQ